MVMCCRRSTRPTRVLTARAQRGFTLVELMVGLTIGLIVVTALLVLFANASATGQNLGRSSTQIENGRYVTELFREDIRLAGMYGEMPDSPTAPVYTNPDPCLTTPIGFVNSPFGLPAPIQGFKPTDVVACLANRKAGTSALVIRRLSVDTTPADAASMLANQYYVQYSFCAGDPSGTLLIFDKTAGAFTLKNFGCAAKNSLRAYVSRIYYVADCNVCGVDTTPTLKRVELVANALVTTPLAEGIEALRFEYGFDTNGDGTPDTYQNDVDSPAATSLWQDVMTVKAHFIVRSLDKIVGAPSTAASGAFALGNVGTVDDPGDKYARRVYSATIRLVNPSGARETPP